MIILSINYKLIVSTNLRQAMQHAKPFHRKSKDNIKNSTNKKLLEKFIFEPRTLLFHMEEISKYKATNSLIACKVSHCVYTLTLVKEKNIMCVNYRSNGLNINFITMDFPIVQSIYGCSGISIV